MQEGEPAAQSRQQTAGMDFPSPVEWTLSLMLMDGPHGGGLARLVSATVALAAIAPEGRPARSQLAAAAKEAGLSLVRQVTTVGLAGGATQEVSFPAKNKHPAVKIAAALAAPTELWLAGCRGDCRSYNRAAAICGPPKRGCHLRRWEKAACRGRLR